MTTTLMKPTLMKPTRLLLVIASGIALAATLVHGADRQPMVVRNITGNLHIEQRIPCDTLTQDTPVTEGRIVITPAEGVDVAGGKSFELIGFNISFAPFTISGSCLGIGGSRTYSLMSVHLGRAVAFTASDRGGGGFDVTIPRDEFFIREAAVVDGSLLEKSVMHPSQDVTGTIDLTRGTVAMHVVVARNIHFTEGDAGYPGTLTVDLSGTIAFPDADRDGVANRADNCRFTANPDQSPVATPVITAPTNVTLASCTDHHIGFAKAADICDGRHVTITSDARGAFVPGSNIVTWTAQDAELRTATDRQIVTVTDTVRPTVACLRSGDPEAPFFRVSSADDCTTSPEIRLGTFVLANGETVQITTSNRPGIMLLGEHGGTHIRHFRVGPGQNVIDATDGSGNQARATCQ